MQVQNSINNSKTPSQAPTNIHTLSRAERIAMRRRKSKLRKIFLAISSVLTVGLAISLAIATAGYCAKLILPDMAITKAYLDSPIATLLSGITGSDGSTTPVPQVLSSIINISFTVSMVLFSCLVIVGIIKRIKKI